MMGENKMGPHVEVHYVLSWEGGLTRLFEFVDAEDVYFMLKRAADAAAYVWRHWDMDTGNYEVKRTLSTDESLEEIVEEVTQKLTEAECFTRNEKNACKQLLEELLQPRTRGWKRVVVFVFDAVDDVYAIALAWS